ncbi:cis-abienol synthase, chloroplastic-like [Nicotiana tabacum]|uniref:Cis-abienol synthase, chloroplastic-like n=1 Tax=Nicotiana tabacum TaxID=4097 RepID=A0AC58UE48_TOBAC
MLHVGSRSKTISLSDYKVTNGYGFYHIVRCNCNHASSSVRPQEVIIKERIRKMFGKIEISPSCYDTAWVAMVPSRDEPKQPCFAQCLDWILENQREDGSWGLSPTHSLLVKDSLSSTLACLLALSKWSVGHKLVQRGLDYIGRQSWSIDNKGQISAGGFDIIFPSMIKYARELNLNVPLDQNLVNVLFQKQDSAMERNDLMECKTNPEYYYAEGLGELCQWEELMTYQKKNGSLFNSPATTSAALVFHCHDEKCLGYINSILKQHKDWVPTIYPTTIPTRLQMVDTLQKLGVDRHFEAEIRTVLDETYRLWEQKDEEVFSDVAYCAMAFRLLRMYNYKVSSEELARFIGQEHFINSLNAQCTSHEDAILELHQASQLAFDEKDHILDEISTWTEAFLQQELLEDSNLDRMSQNEVEHALRNFSATLERAENRRYIESYDVNMFKFSKTAYRSPNIYNMDFTLFSMHDFNLCQTVHQQDIQELKRWYEDCKLDQLGISPKYIYTSYMPMSSLFFGPEFSDARSVFAKYVLLTTPLDDFFDELASQEELLNLIELVKGWNRHSTIGYVSERVEILFLAIYKTFNEFAAKAEIMQGRCVKDQIFDLFLDVLNCMMREVEWWREEKTPSVEEYLSIACVTIAVKAILFTTQYVLGPKLSEEVIKSAELGEICKCTTMVCRLLNDTQTYKKEKEERSSNIVNILVTQSEGTVSEEEAVEEVKEMLEKNRRKLLRMVLHKKESSQLPQVCKDLFWNTSKVAHILYSNGNEFRSPEGLKSNINALFYKPVDLSPTQA